MTTLLRPFSQEFVTYDLEFIADGKTIDLVSVGMKSGDGRTLYAVNRELDERKLLEHGDGWMRKNVWPHLPLTDLPEKQGGNRFPYSEMPVKKCRCAPVAGTSGRDAEYACRCMNGKLDRDHPDVRPLGQIRRLVSDFLLASHPVGVEREGFDRNNILMWAWYGAYDHVCLVQSLWGEMVKLPPYVPMLTHDLKSEAMRLGNPTMPEQKGTEHNALADAEGNLHKARFLWELATPKEG